VDKEHVYAVSKGSAVKLLISSWKGDNIFQPLQLFTELHLTMAEFAFQISTSIIFNIITTLCIISTAGLRI